MWRQYRDLYAGGEQFKLNADRYLVRRQKEPGDVYAERLSRSFYENYIGSIVDWYTATLFRREPVLAFEGNNERAKNFFAEVYRGLRSEGDKPDGVFPQAICGRTGLRKELHTDRFSTAWPSSGNSGRGR